MLAMRRRDVILGGVALAGSASIPRRASASALASFLISPLTDPVWCSSGFPSTGQHVARNFYGAFYAVVTAQGDLVGDLQSSVSVLWDNGSGSLTTLWSGVVPSNMVCIEAFAAGEVHLIYSDQSSSPAIVDLVWQNVTASTTPVVNRITGPGAFNQKIGTCVDDGRRCVYVMGYAGYFFRLSASGQLEAPQQQVTAVVTDGPHYWSLNLDDAGRLYVAICCALSPTDYDSVSAVMSPNPWDAAPVWTTGPWVSGSPRLTLPFDPGVNGPATWMLWGEQVRNSNNLLLSSTVFGGAIHAAVAQSAALNERFFSSDDLRDCSVEITSVPWAGVNSSYNAMTHRPARGQSIFPRCASGSMQARNWGLYAVLADRNNLVALKSTDNGASWHDYASTPVPGLGTDMIAYVGAYRGHLDDPDIIGSFNVTHCTPTQWSAGTAPVPPALAPNNPTATAYRFSLAAA